MAGICFMNPAVCRGGIRIFSMKQLLLICAVLVLVGCVGPKKEHQVQGVNGGSPKTVKACTCVKCSGCDGSCCS